MNVREPDHYFYLSYPKTVRYTAETLILILSFSVYILRFLPCSHQMFLSTSADPNCKQFSVSMCKETHDIICIHTKKAFRDNHKFSWVYNRVPHSNIIDVYSNSQKTCPLCFVGESNYYSTQNRCRNPKPVQNTHLADWRMHSILRGYLIFCPRHKNGKRRYLRRNWDLFSYSSHYPLTSWAKGRFRCK